jgi:serine/threonine protein kinase
MTRFSLSYIVSLIKQHMSLCHIPAHAFLYINSFYGVTHDVSQPGNSIMFIVEEFCAGGNLEQYCTRTDSNYTPAMMARIVTQIFAAMRYMHSQGIAHRDLKPANVLLTASGEVKLADLGLARNFQVSSCLPSVCTCIFFSIAFWRCYSFFAAQLFFVCLVFYVGVATNL